MGPAAPAWQRYGTYAVALALGVALWQVGAYFTKPVFLPTFTRTLARLYEMTVTGVLGDALASSMLVYFTGLIAAIVVGLAIGLLLARVRLLRIALENYIMLLYATPMVALIPFILSMMGFGFSAKAVVVFLFAVFSVLYNTIEGARSLKPEMLEVARSFRSQRMGDLARRADPLHLAFRHDRRAPSHRPRAGGPGGRRILPLRHRDRPADRAQRPGFRRAGALWRDHRDHRARRGVDVGRPRAREPFRRLAGARPMSDLALTPVVSRWRSWISLETLVRILAGVAILLVWEVAVRLWGPDFVARPSRIVAVFPETITNPALWVAFGQTMGSVVQGLLIAVVVGTAIGLAIGRIPVVERLLALYVNGLFAMPMVAILPLLTLWLGYTGDARLATVVFAAIFAIIVNVSDGARAVPPEYVEVSRSFRGSGWSRLFDVILPASVPYLLAGLRLAAGRALIGAVVAEFFAALPGIGFYILFNTRSFRHNEAMVAVAMLAVTGVLFEFVLAKATARLLPWYRRDEARD